MSLVGPRPMSLRDVSLFSEAHLLRRFQVKPGITGLWQISGRSNLTFDQWIALDFSYIDRWSFGLDMQILLATIPHRSGFRGNVERLPNEERFARRQNMVRVALVHDYFTQHGGAENVAGNFITSCRRLICSRLLHWIIYTGLYPEGKATNIVDAKSAADCGAFIGCTSHFILSEYSHWIFRRYDLVISSSSGYGKGVRTRSDALHVCYCHTPMRWVWRYDDYVSRERLTASKRFFLP